MMIKKINLKEVEKSLKEIVEGLTEMKTFKEEDREINKSLNSNEIDFKAGKISNEIYKNIKRDLGKDKKIIETKIKGKRNEVLIILKNLSEIMESSKV